jgi:hypothetical protein
VALTEAFTGQRATPIHALIIFLTCVVINRKIKNCSSVRSDSLVSNLFFHKHFWNFWTRTRHADWEEEASENFPVRAVGRKRWEVTRFTQIEASALTLRLCSSDESALAVCQSNLFDKMVVPLGATP